MSGEIYGKHNASIHGNLQMGKTRRKIPQWWSQQLKKLKKECYKSRKLAQGARNDKYKEQMRAVYQNIRRQYTTLKEKYDTWNKFVETKSLENMWKLVDTIKK